MTTLTVANGRLANNWRDALADYYEPFYGIKSVNDYSGAFKNPHWGDYGCAIFWGGGHAGTNHNGVTILEYGLTSCTFKRVCDPTPWFGTGTDSTTRTDNGGSTATNTNTDLDYMESTIDGKPGSPHSYATGDVLGPSEGGSTYGTFIQVMSSAVNRANDFGAQAAHKLDFADLTATTNPATRLARNWQRVTNNRGPWTSGEVASPGLTAHVPAQQRVYIQANSSYSFVRWFDLATNTYVTGTGTTFGYDSADGFDSGIMFHVPTRNLLVCMYPVGGNLVIQWMDVSVSQPTLGGTATLSSTITTGAPWSAGTWCPDNNRIIVGVYNLGGVYEITIPATLTNTWTVEYAAFTGGGTLPLEAPGAPGNTYKKFGYDARVKSIVFMRTANEATADTVHVYRPRNT